MDRENQIKWFKEVGRHYWDYMQMCQDSKLDIAEDIGWFLRQNDTTYFAPITMWIELNKHFHIDIEDSNYFHVEETRDAIRGVFCEAVIHSIRVLLDRCALLMRIKFPDIDHSKGFGYYADEGGKGNKGLIAYAYKHIHEDDLFKWIVMDYEDWIYKINQFDNGIKHNFARKSKVPIIFNKDEDGHIESLSYDYDNEELVAFNKNRVETSKIIYQEIEQFVDNAYLFIDAIIKYFLC